MTSCSCRGLPSTFAWDPLRPLLAGNTDEVDTAPSLQLLACRSCGQLWRLDLPPGFDPRAAKIGWREDWSEAPGQVTEPTEQAPAPANEVTSLPILKTVGAAFSASWAARMDFLRLAAFPWLTSVLIAGALESWLPDVGAFVYLVNLLTSTTLIGLFAIQWHRRILLGEPASWFKVLAWTPRHAAFLYWSFGVQLPLLPIALIPRAVGPETAPWVAFLLGGFVLVVALVSVYCLSRLSVAFPATALGDFTDIRSAWVTSRGEGWALFFVSLFVAIAGSLILVVFQSSLEHRRLLVLGSDVGWILYRATTNLVLAAISIASLSLAYRWLRDHRGVGPVT